MMSIPYGALLECKLTDKEVASIQDELRKQIHPIVFEPGYVAPKSSTYGRWFWFVAGAMAHYLWMMK